MPGHVELSSPLEKQLLAQLGARLRQARVQRQMTVVELANGLGMSRSTLYAAEAGEPSAAMGTYVRLLGALGLVSDLALVASPASARPLLTETGNHQPQDLQSLLMHREAVSMLRKDPSLADRALHTLSRWRRTADPRSHSLLDEWQRIIECGDWAAAVQENERGSQLRQASPLSTLLPSEIRLNIISEVKALKGRVRRAKT